jgi:hypothetical protein
VLFLQGIPHGLDVSRAWAQEAELVVGVPSPNVLQTKAIVQDDPAFPKILDVLGE